MTALATSSTKESVEESLSPRFQENIPLVHPVDAILCDDGHVVDTALATPNAYVLEFSALDASPLLTRASRVAITTAALDFPPSR